MEKWNKKLNLQGSGQSRKTVNKSTPKKDVGSATTRYCSFLNYLGIFRAVCLFEVRVRVVFTGMIGISLNHLLHDAHVPCYAVYF